MRLVRAGLRAFVLPLVAPFETAHGTIRGRAGFLVSLEDDTGRFGIGEATPLPAFGGEDLDACRAALLGLLGALVDRRDGIGEDALDVVRRMGDGTPCARAAIESALADLAAQRAGLSLARWIRARAELPGEAASRVRVQALVAGARPEAVAASALRARAAGFDTYKLKLAVSPAQRALGVDLERVAALRSAIGASGRIRLDANEAWSREEAESALVHLARFDVELLEQPVARRDLASLAALARTSPIPIAADEALLEGGLEACLAGRRADVFVVKPSVLGGVERTIALARRAEAGEIRLVFSNLIEGSVGRATALALAAGLARTGADEVHGLGTAALLARDFEPAPSASLAVLTPFAGPGLGTTLGPCWALEGELFGEGTCFETGSASRVTPSLRARWGAAGEEKGWLEGLEAQPAHREALVFGSRAWSYAELARAVQKTGQGLASIGIGAGDFVAVLAPPSPEGVVLIHALLDGGIVLLPVNTRLAEPEIVEALVATGVSTLFVSDAIDVALARRVAEAAGCGLDVFSAAEAGPDAAAARDPVPVLRRERAARVEPRVADRAAALRRERAALVLLTSGTSGRSKAAILTRENLIASADASALLLGSGADDRWLLCLPLFHIAGLSILVRAARVGACVVLESRFEAGRIAERLETSAISHVSLVATTLEQLLDARGRRRAPASLRLVLVGGGPAAEGLLERALRAGYPIAPTYGLTEAASQVATRPPGSGRSSEAPQAGGLVSLPGVALRIVDAGGRPVAPGVEGEIELRGPIVMRGYLGDPEATARVLRRGWLATGDVGRLDESGRLRILDRRSDLIVSGGENVYPAEIESLLVEHPDVVEAGVVGVADARYGARPLAFVVWRAGSDRNALALSVWCRTRLAGYKLPVGFIASEALPRNASGKLLRRELARRASGRGGEGP